MSHHVPRITGVLLVLIALGCQPETPPPIVEEAEATAEPTEAPLSPEAGLSEIKARLETIKTALFEEGEYNCCVEPSCDWCALHEGNCSCFTNVTAGEAVCPGCGLGWHNGQGIVDGVEASDVKWEITHEHPAGGGHPH